MNNSKNLGKLRKGEIIGGIIYWPCYLLLVPVLLTIVLTLFGIDVLTDMGSFQLNISYFIVNFIAITIIFRRFLLEQIGLFGKTLWKSLQAAVLGLVFYYLLSVLLGYLLQLLPWQVDNANNDAVMSLVGTNYTLMLVMTVVVAPVVEECLCRGLFFCGLYGKSRFWAYALSMLAFAAIHVLGAAFSQPIVTTLLCVLEYLPAGFMLAWAYQKGGNLVCPILVHAGINLVSMLALKWF